MFTRGKLGARSVSAGCWARLHMTGTTMRRLCAGTGVGTIVAIMALAFSDPAFAQEAGAGLQRAPVGGGTLEYEIRGQGEPVVLIHGAFVADLLRPLATEATFSHYRVIRLHRRGYAGSSPVDDTWSIKQDAADVAALLRYLGVRRAHVVGHSSGAIVALEFAATYPDMTRTLTLLDPPLQFAAAQHFQPRTGGVDSVEAFLRARASPGVIEQLEVQLPGALQQTMRDARRFNVVEWVALGAWTFDSVRAQRVTAPVLVVSQRHGANVDTARRWWPRSEFVELRGQTHLFPFEAPAETAAAITRFLARHAM